MGIELARVFMRVVVDASRVRSALKAIQRDSSRTVRSMADEMRGISIGAAGMFGAVTAAAVGILRRGFSGANFIEQATTEMEVMTGSITEVKDVLTELTQYAVDTPFTMPELLSPTRSLMLFGERGTQLMDTLKMLGDVSGGVSTRFKILEIVFNQIRGVGHLLTQDFRQLSTRGMLSLTDIANHFKVSMNKASRMITRGKVKFEDVRAIMKGLTSEGGRFHQMLLKQSQTTSGMLNILKDSLDVIMRMVVVPLIPTFKFLLRGVTQIVSLVAKGVSYFREVASFAFLAAAGVAAIGSSLGTLVIVARLLGTSFGNLLVGGGLAAGFMAGAAALGALVGYLSQFKVLQDAIATRWQSIVDWIQQLVAKIQEGWRMVGVLSNVFEEMYNLISEQIIPNLIDNFDILYEDVIEIIHSLTGGMEVDFYDWFQYAMDTLKWILEGVSFFTTDFKKSFGIMWANLKILGIDFVNTIVNAFWDMVSILAGIGQVIIAIFKEAFISIGQLFGATLSAIKGLFLGFWAGVKSKFTGGEFMQTFHDEFNKEIAKIEGDLEFKVDVPAAFKEGQDNFQNIIGARPEDPLFQATRNAANAEIARLKAEIAQQQEINLMLRIKSSKPKENEGKEETGRGKLKKLRRHPSEYSPQVNLEAGRYGFMDLGNKIQDLVLGNKKDTGEQQVELLKKSNAIGEQQVRGQEDIKGKLGLGK